MVDCTIWLICGVVAALLYWWKGHRGAPALTLSLLFGPVAVLLAALTPPSSPANEFAAQTRAQPATALRSEIAPSAYAEAELPQAEPAAG
jgi:hypothetical protein